MIKLISILLLMVCFSSCISKTERNKSLLNGLWERDCKGENCTINMSLLYFSNEHALIRGWGNRDIKSRVIKNKLTLKLYDPKTKIASRDVKFDILKLDAKELVLLSSIQFGSEGIDTLFFHRKEQLNKVELINLSVASNGLEDLEIQLDKSLTCSFSLNRERSKKLKTLSIPAWKWQALNILCRSIMLKSKTYSVGNPITVCGGYSGMIIETKRKEIYKYFEPDRYRNDIAFLNDIIFGIGIETKLYGIEKTGTIKFHKQLSDLFPSPPEEKVLQFIPPN